MNRRVILVDSQETPGYISYFGCGLGNDIHTIQEIKALDESDRKQFLNFTDTDAILLVGGSPFKYLRQFYHFGIRGENYFDCSKLRRLSIEGGAFVKCISDFPDEETINDFMSPEFTKHVVFPGFKSKVIHTYQEAISFINYLESLPENQYFGMDYEASGMAMDKVFFVSGVSIVTEKYGGFISLTDIRHELGGENTPGYKGLLQRLARLFEKCQDHIFTYNMAYEFMVSHRILGVDLYNLCDASAVNVMDGYHMKKYSLKWTAQRVLQVDVWDADFDRIDELIDSALFETVGKLKRDKHKVFKVDQNNFYKTPEWKELSRIYPDKISEFNQLLLEYWGFPFMCVPSDILGHYCCLDSFYTLMIAESRFNSYSQDCWNVNLDNIRLGARLMNSGLYIDEPYRKRYEVYCHEQMAWGITYCAAARCYTKMEKHRALAADITKYTPEAVKLLEKGEFHQGNAIEIVKYLLLSNIDTLDAYSTGLNEGQLVMEYGQKFATQFVQAVKDAMTETKFKGKIDESVKRKRKILGVLGEKIKPILGLDKLKLGNKHIELEKYVWYKSAYEELQKVKTRQLTDIHNVPETIHAFGQNFTQLEYSKYVSDNFFKCKSPIENDEIAFDYASLYRTESSYLAAMLESTQQLKGTTHFYEQRGISDINTGYLDFMDQWRDYTYGVKRQYDYPDKTFNLALQFWQSIKSIGDLDDKIKEVWTNINGLTSQYQYFSAYRDQYLDYEKGFDPSDFKDKFFFMRKFTLNYLIFKKYSKLDSTYVGDTGMFHKTGKWVIEGPDHIPVRDADETEPGAVWKVFVHYEVMTKSSKRWSSPFHTIISHGDCKDCICPPPAWDNNGNIIYGGSDQVLTYFDISSAEVKAAGFASKDPDLIAKFEAGEDIYIYSAKLYLGEDGWNDLDKPSKKKWRKKFKTVFLGVLYGLGKNSLAVRLDSSVEEAEKIIQSLYHAFPKLREYVDRQGKYPLQHSGYINTMLGDKLQVQEWSILKKTGNTDRERNNIIARIQRLGVNLPIQGGTSSIMQSGFFNNIRVSVEHGKNQESVFHKHALQPIITVHDSNTNLIPVEFLFDARPYYDKNYTEYCHNIGPGIYLLFDLLAGYSYERATTLNQIDQDTIEFTGSSYQIIGLYDKIMSCKDIQPECDTTREDILKAAQPVNDPYQRFIIEGGCSMVKDLSRITVRFHRNKRSIF